MAKKNMAEKFFDDALNAIKESQNDLEKSISSYTSGFGNKPPIDMLEDDLNIIVKVDLPGFLKENIKIDISDDALEINALFLEEILHEGAYYVKRERNNREIRRVIELPASIKIDSANATFTDGVLQVTLPKLGRTGVNVD